jgi:hypothetical protein
MSGLGSLDIRTVPVSSGKKVGEVHVNQPVYAGTAKTGKYEPLHFEELDGFGKIPPDAIHEWFPQMYGWRP